MKPGAVYVRRTPAAVQPLPPMAVPRQAEPDPKWFARVLWPAAGLVSLVASHFWPMGFAA